MVKWQLKFEEIPKPLTRFDITVYAEDYETALKKALSLCGLKGKNIDGRNILVVGIEEKADRD